MGIVILAAALAVLGVLAMPAPAPARAREGTMFRTGNHHTSMFRTGWATTPKPLAPD